MFDGRVFGAYSLSGPCHPEELLVEKVEQLDKICSATYGAEGWRTGIGQSTET